MTAEGPALVQVNLATIFIPRAHWLHFVGFFALYGHGVRLNSIELEFIQRERDKPRRGVVASTLSLFRQRAIGFIDWLDLLMWRVLALRSFAGFGAVPRAIVPVINGRMTSGAEESADVNNKVKLDKPAPQLVNNN